MFVTYPASKSVYEDEGLAVYGGGGSAAIYVNAKSIGTNTTIPANFNGMSAGAITINSGVTVTVASGSRWVIV